MNLNEKGYIMYDCGFTKANYRFRYRAGGILVHDNKVLFVKSANGDYYYVIGGGVRLGETSEMCVEREFLEETGIRAKPNHLLVVCENFFRESIEGLDWHTIEFYYYMKIIDDNLSVCRDKTDVGEKLVWLPIDKIHESEIKPSFIKRYLKKIITDKKIIHVIEDKDR